MSLCSSFIISVSLSTLINLIIRLILHSLLRQERNTTQPITEKTPNYIGTVGMAVMSTQILIRLKTGRNHLLLNGRNIIWQTVLRTNWHGESRHRQGKITNELYESVSLDFHKRDKNYHVFLHAFPARLRVVSDEISFFIKLQYSYTTDIL